MTKVTTYIEGGREFLICKCDDGTERNGYWAFEDKDIGPDGKLLKQFNGISGFHSQTVAECIGMVSTTIKVDALVAGGMDRMEAAVKVVCGK